MPKYAYANEREEFIISQKLGSDHYWLIDSSAIKEDESARRPLFSGPEVLSSASNKPKLFTEIFLENSNLNDTGISQPF